MSDAEAKNDKKSNDIGAGPTRSFNGSELGTGSQIGPFRIERELGRGAVVFSGSSVPPEADKLRL